MGRISGIPMCPAAGLVAERLCPCCERYMLGTVRVGSAGSNSITDHRPVFFCVCVRVFVFVMYACMYVYVCVGGCMYLFCVGVYVDMYVCMEIAHLIRPLQSVCLFFFVYVFSYSVHARARKAHQQQLTI